MVNPVDQCCPSTTDWYTGIKVYWVYKEYKVYWVYKGYKGYKANFWENEDTHLAGIQGMIGIKGIQSL